MLLITYRLFLAYLRLLMILDFDFHFLSSAYGDSDKSVTMMLHSLCKECIFSASHSLPQLPVDRSNTNVHGILKPQQVFFWVLWHICHIWHLDCLCYIQNIALLSTLWILHSTGCSDHITVFNTLAISHTKHPLEQHISCWQFASKKLKGSNRQDFVFIRQPDISHGVFELWMDNLWFCKVLLLFLMESKTDMGWKRHLCAFVSVMEEYTGPQRPGIILSLLIILRLLIVQILLC